MNQEHDQFEEKRQAAIAWLGERWLLHPSHSPQRGEPKLVEANLARIRTEKSKS